MEGKVDTIFELKTTCRLSQKIKLLGNGEINHMTMMF